MGGRFIPAYAGNSPQGSATLSFNSVHPRLRGELGREDFAVSCLRGSSPLTRGTQHEDSELFWTIRFIPAYAGNSFSRGTKYKSVSVHPRLRGELSVIHLMPPESIGSSPLTRGTPQSSPENRDPRRFIPAYAGNSLKDGINPSIHTLGI